MFCEECGAQLEPGARFCENCGTPVPQENLKEEDSFSEAQIPDCKENGLIVTSLGVLAYQLGTSKENINNLISKYISFCRKKGVAYSVVDIENPDVEAVINTISQNNRTSKIKYVFILGNEAVIPTMEFNNLCNDGDLTVPSDLPYATLTTDSPFCGFKSSPDKMFRVGRLVSYQGESFEKFASYFENVMNCSSGFSSIKPYGLSAKVWKNETDFEYQNVLSGTKADCSVPDSSPVITVSTVETFIPCDANLLMFNLHGSDKTEYWYGQEEAYYPEAVQPESLGVLHAPYVIGVEACYGANYYENLNENQSILVKALQSGCVSFLGSSKIAYGTSAPKGSCADFMIGEYLKQMKNGETAGDSFIAGIMRVVKETTDFSDSEIKTIAEFNLYGDPSLSIGNIGGSKNCSKSSFVPSLNVALPDVRTAVRMSIAEVDEKISDAINEYVYEHYEDLRGCMPTTYKLEGRDLFNSIYKKENGAGNASQINRVVKIYFDKSGKIKKELESK